MFVKCMQHEWHGTRDYGKHRENNVAPDLKILKLSWRERLTMCDFKEKLNNIQHKKVSVQNKQLQKNQSDIILLLVYQIDKDNIYIIFKTNSDLNVS